ncbi:hypothetical protein F5I97DRAFT_1900401 [Phlebopus sp. FC_14]|nr:hypothetical protein F5I97DRAFT_1900401 [Phlebopus sp. FC_14]
MSGIHGQASSPNGEDRDKEGALYQFYDYPFSSDEVFQRGLADILAHDPKSMGERSDSEKAELILQTKLFYFSRITGYHLCLQDVQDRLCTADPTNSRNEYVFTPSSESYREGETRFLTFAELKSLIEQGKTDDIPNNKVIPDALSEDAPSESTAPIRKKPWEVASES